MRDLDRGTCCSGHDMGLLCGVWTYMCVGGGYVQEDVSIGSEKRKHSLF